MNKKIVIAGGTGFIGKYFERKFTELNYEVIIISRQNQQANWNNPQSLTKAMEQASAVINLAGRSINCIHNEKNKQEILQSRIDTTRLLGEAIKNCVQPPSLWLNASSQAIYPPSKNATTENSTHFAKDFLATVTQQWEQTFFDYKNPKTRQIALRIAIVLGKDGGAFPPLYHLAKYGLGGTQGSGKQMMSWVHIEDLFQLCLFSIHQNSLTNCSINCCAPNAISNQIFMQTLREKLKMPIGLPAAEWMIKIGAKFLQTEADLLLGSCWIYPKTLLDNGFQFSFPTIDTAIENLVS